MENEKLSFVSKKMRTIWLLGNAVVFVILTAAAVTAIFLSVFNVAVTAAAAAVWLILSVLLFVFPFLRYRNYKYGYDRMRIYICYGVIFRHRIVIPVCQIQDLHYTEGPVMILFGLGGIIFSTAGSNFTLVGLDKLVAQKTVADVEQFLNERIEEKRNEEV